MRWKVAQQFVCLKEAADPDLKILGGRRWSRIEIDRQKCKKDGYVVGGNASEFGGAEQKCFFGAPPDPY